MGDLINLNRVRKRGERDLSARQADANRAQYGRTKQERTLDEQRRKRIETNLDQHKLGDKDAS